MGERQSSWRRADEWVPVIPPAYAAARQRHAAARAEAYAIAREAALEESLCGPELHVTDIDAAALDVWKHSWTGVHPSAAGGWSWPLLLERVPRRAAVLPMAIWYGGDLCGLGIGQASRRRFNGSRHTVTLTFVERRPEPPAVPLRGQVFAIAASVAREYGVILGARQLRLRAPDRNLLPYYETHGFQISWKGTIPVHCEKEIQP